MILIGIFSSQSHSYCSGLSVFIKYSKRTWKVRAPARPFAVLIRPGTFQHPSYVDSFFQLSNFLYFSLPFTIHLSLMLFLSHQPAIFLLFSHPIFSRSFSYFLLFVFPISSSTSSFFSLRCNSTGDNFAFHPSWIVKIKYEEGPRLV